MSSQETPRPLLKSADIERGYKTSPHVLNPQAIRHSVDMSAAVGMKDMAVFKSKLDPYTDSTVNHYHLNESEWVYILSGSGTLTLIDASPALLRGTGATLSGELPPSPDPSSLEKTVHPVGEGDFMGFKMGAGASRYSHSLTAGAEGLVYIEGGPRSTVNVCAYPELGRTLAYERVVKSGEEDLVSTIIREVQ
ncbi:hypothetical protein IAR50_003100 [Cryptococcus sp. DSM 104548]